MFIKRPNNYRATYSLIGNDGKVLHDPRVDAVNADLKAGVASDLLKARMKAILESYKAPQTKLSLVNEKLVLERHRKKLQRKPWLANPEDLKQRLLRAAAAMGETSILEATEDQIYDALDHVTESSARFEILRGIQELLKFAGRKIQLVNPRVSLNEEITYIRIADFEKRAAKLVPEYRIYLGALFATGARYGELPLLKIEEHSVVVSQQVRKTGAAARTKNKKVRRAPILPPLMQYVKEARLLGQDRLRELRLEHYYKLYGACKRVLGINIHSLRHSYCVEWASVGANEHDLAYYIGDTPEVVKSHYRNYLATDEVIERAFQLWNKK
jgi:integrase